MHTVSQHWHTIVDVDACAGAIVQDIATERGAATQSTEPRSRLLAPHTDALNVVTLN
jgi:hypothetical protein